MTRFSALVGPALIALSLTARPLLASPATAARPSAQTAAKTAAQPAAPGGEGLLYDYWRLETMLTRARDQISAGKLDAALQTCTRARGLGLWDPRLESLVGEIHLHRGHWTEAVVALRRSTMSRTDKCNLAVALTQTARSRHAEGRFADETRLLKEALSRDPQNALAHASLGLAFLQQGDRNLALSHCRQAVELAPTSADAWSSLSVVCLAAADLPQAHEAAQRAVDVSPDDPAALSNLAFLVAEEGDTAGAARLWEQATRLAPSYADAYAGLAVAQWRLGDRDRSRSLYRKAIGLDATYDDPRQLGPIHYWTPKAVKTATEIRSAR
ncbi:tetratricopeptide repeat protein [bacterium]|nr:tetratricopeptide repeat protein [bacterium]